MKQKEIEAEKYALECKRYDGINPTFDSEDAKEMRVCGYMRGYEAALANQWSSIKQLPPNGAHCLIKKRGMNKKQLWQWNYSIAEFVAPSTNNHRPFFRVYDMLVSIKDVTHWMLIPED